MILSLLAQKKSNFIGATSQQNSKSIDKPKPQYILYLMEPSIAFSNIFKQGLPTNFNSSWFPNPNSNNLGARYKLKRCISLKCERKRRKFRKNLKTHEVYHTWHSIHRFWYYWDKFEFYWKCLKQNCEINFM
jgi:hypothetical protein